MTAPTPQPDDTELPADSIHEPSAANPSPSKGLAEYAVSVKPPRPDDLDERISDD